MCSQPAAPPLAAHSALTSSSARFSRLSLFYTYTHIYR